MLVSNKLGNKTILYALNCLNIIDLYYMKIIFSHYKNKIVILPHIINLNSLFSSYNIPKLKSIDPESHIIIDINKRNFSINTQLIKLSQNTASYLESYVDNIIYKKLNVITHNCSKSSNINNNNF